MRTHRDVREVTDEELQQLRLIPSEPEVLAAAAGEGAVAEFRYEDDGDDRGLIYWLGTRGYLKPFTSPMSFGQINVQSSNMDVGEEITIVSRTVKECRTVDESGR
jgi:alpha-D-ribose 1-methylphosphonate 5-triphosphate synthase subunit PhnI